MNILGRGRALIWSVTQNRHQWNRVPYAATKRVFIVLAWVSTLVYHHPTWHEFSLESDKQRWTWKK